jgi:diadenosine tetraphosphatase ApaH/serine/threonine PP2A family protein phosphatase
MRLGIVSDIHGNCVALRRVLEFLRGRDVTSYLCLGDIVGYGPEPECCVDEIRALRGPVVAGNHDYGVLGRIPLSAFNAAAGAAIIWTRSRLDENAISYLESLPLTEHCDPLYLVHASPSAPDQWEYVFSAREAEDEMRSFPGSICVVGHSHYPFAVEQRNGVTKLVHPESFVVRPDSRYLINAGSVGQPRDGNPRACCVIYDTDTRKFTFHRVEYDIRSVQRKVRKAGLPGFLADRLANGR